MSHPLIQKRMYWHLVNVSPGDATSVCIFADINFDTSGEVSVEFSNLSWFCIAEEWELWREKEREKESRNFIQKSDTENNLRCLLFCLPRSFYGSFHSAAVMEAYNNNEGNVRWCYTKAQCCIIKFSMNQKTLWTTSNQNTAKYASKPERPEVPSKSHCVWQWQ